MPTLPLTQLDERGPAADLDNRTFTLTFAQPVPVRDLLLLLVRGTNLSLIPDPAITGSFIGELKNVTVRQALDSILPPLGLDYGVDGGFIRVFGRERDTRIFDINYIAAERSATSTLGGRAVDPGCAQLRIGRPRRRRRTSLRISPRASRRCCPSGRPSISIARPDCCR